jgi:hypothetical protein
MKTNRSFGLIAMLAIACCGSSVVAQRLDYNYGRKLTPVGFSTTSFVPYDYVNNEVSTLAGAVITKTGLSIRDIQVNPTGASVAVLSNTKKATELAVYSTTASEDVLYKFKNKLYGPASAIAYTADARKLVVAHGTKAVIYDQLFTVLGTFDLPYEPTMMQLSDNNYFLAITDGHHVNVINFETYADRKSWNFDSTVNDFAFSA